LGELKPNPFKKDIQNGRIDPVVVKQIVESTKKTSFWEQWVARKYGDEYQIAFGHHRLAAAIELFGKKHEVSVQIEPYTDEQMLIALADENAGPESTLHERIDTVLVAQKFLNEHPESCKRNISAGRKTSDQGGGCKVGDHDGLCVTTLLGEENWSKTTVYDALALWTKLDPIHRRRPSFLPQRIETNDACSNS
jgi:hypothetical protein